jgi:hypothetical protein
LRLLYDVSIIIIIISSSSSSSSSSIIIIIMKVLVHVCLTEYFIAVHPLKFCVEN